MRPRIAFIGLRSENLNVGKSPFINSASVAELGVVSVLDEAVARMGW
jgi:hypothetical protein